MFTYDPRLVIVVCITSIYIILILEKVKDKETTYLIVIASFILISISLLLAFFEN